MQEKAVPQRGPAAAQGFGLKVEATYTVETCDRGRRFATSRKHNNNQSLSSKAPASHERARRVRAMAHRSGAIGGSGKADESRGGGTRRRVGLVPLEPGRVVAASPLARQRDAGLGSGVLRTRLLAGGKQRLIDWLIK